MSRPNAATVRRPGANAATVDDQAEVQAEPTGVAAAAESATVEGTIDPHAIEQPRFDPEQGWVCPAPKTGTGAKA
ncbi:hypothetical protein [Lysobacter sp. ESA13C]|uniref:hypothetical protein n=1 Tax=Lysobacter sp. ESA13C TaxID=2862676 RepID=UPI001CC0B8E9|nr:hypothetical protein [Lysobacter sp. ESA13C]